MSRKVVKTRKMAKIPDFHEKSIKSGKKGSISDPFSDQFELAWISDLRYLAEGVIKSRKINENHQNDDISRYFVKNHGPISRVVSFWTKREIPFSESRGFRGP